MSKQIYIDSNGNEIQVSGTVNTADMMPMSGNDSTKVATAIGDLSTLTTTDKSSLVDAINEIASYTPVYGNTASGAIATFDTSLALPLQDCTIAINAVQESGTPTPSSPKAISGFTGANIKVAGANLWNEEWELGTLNISDGSEVASSTNIRNIGYISALPNTTYYFNRANIAANIFEYDYNHTFVRVQSSPNEFTTSENCRYIRFYMGSAYGTTYNNDISINYPATDTAYHAYDGHTIAISWQSEAGTVYGGSLDVTSGVLTVTHWGHIFNGSESFGQYETNKWRWDCQTLLKSSFNQQSNTKCSHFLVETAGGGWSDLTENHFMVAGNQFIAFGYNGTLSTFLTTEYNNGTPVTIVALLQTPVTYQLTPTQISAIVGTNNVFTDTNGDTSLEYYTNKTVKDAIGDLSQLTTTDKSSIVGAVNEVVTGLGTKAKITRKKYSVTLASNTFVAPFTYFYRLDISSDTLLYGLPIGVWATNSAVTPHIENSYNIDCLGGSAITCDVYVFFASNVNIIS